MDPNETLRMVRATIKQMGVETNPAINAAYAELLAEYVTALDEWLSGGGFLPTAWATA